MDRTNKRIGRTERIGRTDQSRSDEPTGSDRNAEQRDDAVLLLLRPCRAGVGGGSPILPRFFCYQKFHGVKNPFPGRICSGLSALSEHRCIPRHSPLHAVRSTPRSNGPNQKCREPGPLAGGARETCHNRSREGWWGVRSRIPTQVKHRFAQTNGDSSFVVVSDWDQLTRRTAKGDCRGRIYPSSRARQSKRTVVSIKRTTATPSRVQTDHVTCGRSSVGAQRWSAHSYNVENLPEIRLRMSSLCFRSCSTIELVLLPLL